MVWGSPVPPAGTTCVTPGRGPRAFLRRTRGSAAFTPPDVAGLTLWLKGDGTLWQDSARTTPATADADPVGAWDDASGNARHYTQATAGNRPALRTAVLNSLPVVRFDASDDNLTGACGGSKSVFLVAKYAAATFSGYDGLFGDVSNGLIVFTGDNLSGNWFSTSADSLYRNGAANGSSVAPMNAFEAHAAFRSAGWSGASGVVGNDRGDTGRTWDGDVAEVVGYDTVLGATDRDNVFEYLRAKYALY